MSYDEGSRNKTYDDSWNKTSTRRISRTSEISGLSEGDRLSHVERLREHIRQQSSSPNMSLDYNIEKYKRPSITNSERSIDRSGRDGRQSKLSVISENNWLSNLQRDVMVEADSVRESVLVVQDKLSELNKFAEDDRSSTKDEFQRIANKVDNRKRKLAQSLAMIMNTQDSNRNYNVLPPLPSSEQNEQILQHRLSLKRGLVRLEDESVDFVIDEFNQRIHLLDERKAKMGVVDDIVIAQRDRFSQSRKMERYRAMLSMPKEFSLYSFEEDEVKRIRATQRWHSSQVFVLAVVKLMLPLRRRKRSRRNWRKAANLFKAANAFKTGGSKRAVRRFNSKGEEIVVEESSSEEETEYDFEGNKKEKLRKIQKELARKQAYKSSDEKFKELTKKPGWVPPPDIEERKKKFDAAQMARIRWRHAIGAAKCIARMKEDNNDSDDEDANYEFKFTETRTPVTDKNGDVKYVNISRTQLVNTVTGQVKVLAASNFHATEEKEQFKELKGEPAKPGVSNLLHVLSKRPDHRTKAKSAASIKLHNEQDLLIAQQQQLSAQLAQSALTSGSAGFVTAAQYKEMEERKKAAAVAEAEEEAARLEEEEKNFSYHDTKKEQGLTWEELNSSIGLRGRSKAEDLVEDDNMEISPFDIAPEDPLRFGVWEIVRSPRFETFVLLAILCNCVQLALYNPEVDNSASGVVIFEPPFTPYKIFEIIFMFLFPMEAGLKLYVYRAIYFTDFWNKIDFFCVLLIFVNLVPGIPNLTVIRTLRMLKPLRSISRLPTLKVIVTTLVRSAQQIIDVYIICFFVFLVFAVLTADMFGGVFAQRCLIVDEYCSTNSSVYLNQSSCPTEWIVDASIQPDYMTDPIPQRSCGFHPCSDGYKCYLGNLVEYNPEGGALNFDNVPYALLTVFVVITRKGWVDILHRLWDTYGFVFPTVIMVILNMFGSYLLTQLVTAAITVTYEKVDDELLMVIAHTKLLEKMKKEAAAKENGEEFVDDAEEKAVEYDEDGNAKKDPYDMVGDCIRGADFYSDEETRYYARMNDYCSMFFALELVLKFLSEGFRYFDLAFNQFDTLVVIACLVDIYYDLEGASAARFFRIINLVNKSTRVESLKKIIVSIQSSLGPLSGVVTLAAIFLFVFAVGSIQLYGLSLSRSDRLHFKDFPHAMLTVFVLFTGDGWSTIMYKIIYEEGPSNVMFFVIFIIYGMFGLSMLILATLISKFDCGEKDEFNLASVLPIHSILDEIRRRIDDMRTGGEKKKRRKELELADLRRRGLLQEEGQTEEEKKAEEKRLLKEEEEKKKKLAKEKEDQKKKDAIVLTERQIETTKAKNFYFVQADNTLLKEHPSVSLRVCAAETQEQVDKELAPEELNGPIGYGYLKITSEGMLHTYFLNKVVDKPWFENFIMFCIVVSCAMLAYEGPGLSDNDPMADHFALADNIFLLIFILECVLRIAHKGFLFTNVAYLKDPWNQLDFFIVISNVISAVFISVGGSFSNFRALRGFRALRPLRALKNAPELKTIVDVIANCLPVFINLIFCSVVFYGVAGILMMNMFSGRFWRCNDPTISDAKNCGGYFSAYELDYFEDNTTAVDYNEFIPTDNIMWAKKFEPSKTIDGVPMIVREWYNAPRNFDSASAAMLTIFELSTLDHWVEVLFLCMDSSPQPGRTPLKVGKRWPYAFVVIFIIIIGNYLLMNLLVCGVVVVYDKLKTDGSRDDPNISRGQREFVDAIKLMLRTRPGYRQMPPEVFGLVGMARNVCYQIVMFDLGEDQRGTTFELAISVLVVFNTLVLALYTYKSPTRDQFFRIHSDEYDELQNTEWATRLDLIGDCLSAVFFFEMVLKIVAFGPLNYWRDSWNKFDFVVVWSGIIQNLIDGFMGYEILPTEYTEASSGFLTFDPKVLRILRVARLVRVVRLLKGLAKYDRVQSITQLVDTLSNCIKHIINVFFLWLLVTVTFALMCMSLFGTIPVHNTAIYDYGSYGEYSNFRTFPRTLVVLFQVATLDGWTRLMRDVMNGERYMGSSPWAWAFFVIYLIITAFLFLNIFTAIVMDQYDFTARVTSKPRSNGVQRQIMTFNQASTISEEWSYIDPQKTDFIDELKVRKLLFKVGPPIGFAPEADRAKQLRHLRRMELRMTGMSRQVHYVDFFISCVVFRYRQQRKPLADIEIMKIRGKLALEIQLAFPSIKDTRLDDSNGLISAVQACQYLQSHYRGLILRRMMAKGDHEGVMNHTENRQKQLERQAEQLAKEIEEATKAAKKIGGKDKKDKKKSKKKKK